MPTIDHAPPTGRTARAATLPAAASLALLGGCATMKVDDLAMTPTRAPTPTAFFVDVDVADELAGDPAARKVAVVLRERLLTRYTKAGMRVSPGDGRNAGANVATMHVEVSRAKPGNKFKRFVIGLGAGSSTLGTNAVLQVSSMRGPALRFSSRAGSGLRPGFIVPGGIAAASGETSGLPISAGLGLLSVTRSGLNSDADRSAKRIVAETREHYQRIGWRWPTA